MLRGIQNCFCVTCGYLTPLHTHLQIINSCTLTILYIMGVRNSTLYFLYIIKWMFFFSQFNQGKRVFYVTNNSTKTRMEYKDKCCSMGYGAEMVSKHANTYFSESWNWTFQDNVNLLLAYCQFNLWLTCLYVNAFLIGHHNVIHVYLMVHLNCLSEWHNRYCICDCSVYQECLKL